MSPSDAAVERAPRELPDALRAILVDPDDHQPLEWVPELRVFRNRSRRRDYPVVDDVARLHPSAASDA